MPSLTIGKRKARYPIVQGGMAVRISLSPLAIAVANAGGVGIIAGSGLEPEELAEEVRKTREATDGVFGVNIMVAVSAFKELVQVALAEGADIIIAGAGFSRDVFTWCKEAGAEMVPVVGSARVAKLAEKFGASAVVVEGMEAGGHLGTDRALKDLLPEIVEAVNIPVIAAGGIVTGADIKEVMDLGASGVQMGTRFAATEESSAAQVFKQLYVDATDEDVILVKSPVGLPGRALRTALTERLAKGEYPKIDKCISCLKRCGKEYCIVDKLLDAQKGKLDNGLFFSGTSASRIHDIPSAGEVVSRLVSEWKVAAEGGV